MKKIAVLLFFTVLGCTSDATINLEEYKKLPYEEHLKIIDSLLLNDKNNGVLLYEKARLFYNKNKYDEAKTLIESALVELNKTNNTKYLAKAYFINGAIHATPTTKEIGNKYLLKALQYASEIKDSTQLANIYSSLAHVQYLYKDFLTAIEYMKNAEVISIKLKDTKSLSSTYNNLAILYREINDIDNSLDYNYKSLKLSESIKDSVSIAKSYNNIGNVYKHIGESKKAEEYFLKAKKINTALNPLNNSPQLNLGQQYFLSKKYLLAKQQYLKALKIEKINNRISKLIEIYDNLLNISIHEKDFDNALLYKTKRDSIALKISKLENQEKLNLLENQYKVTLQEKELQQQKRINIKNQIIFLSVLSLFILTAIILFLRYKNTRLKLKQEKISLELKVLRSQMNPHFIFNALSAIQNSLLDNNPIKSASYLSKFAKLIRQNFDFVNKKKIPLNDEIDALTNYINTQQMRFENKFDYQITIDKNINTETTEIPPLLLQPFVENAIEHGFKNKNVKGCLSISISKKDDTLFYEIKDNGVGFDTSKKTKEEHAIDVLKKRLKLLGNQDEKSFSITSSSNGTTVTFNLKDL